MISKQKYICLIGLRIKKLREKRKYTQEEFAHIINKDRQSLQRVERGKVNPSIFYLYTIANGFDISISELLDIDNLE